MISGTKFTRGKIQNDIFCQSGLESDLFSHTLLISPGSHLQIIKNGIRHTGSFSSFQGPEVICNEIRLPIGAIRAHFKSLKSVVLPKTPRISGFLKKRHLNSWFLALNSPWVRSRTTFFANRGLNRTWFHPLLSHPRVSPSDHQKRYPAFQIFFKLSGTPGHLRRDPPSNRC